MSGEPNRGPDPGCLSSFLPRGFGLPIAIERPPPPEWTQLPREEVNDGARIRQLASVRQIEQLSDRLLVCRGEFVLVHLLRRDPAMVVHLFVIDVTAQEPAAVDAEVDVVMR